MDCSTPSFPVLHHLQEFAQTHVHWCHPTTSSCHSLLLPSTFHTIRIFSNELALRIRWPKYWASALASVFPMNIIHCSYGDELQSYSSYRDEFSPWRNLELRMTDLSNSTGYVKWVCTFSVDQATSSPCENSHLKIKDFRCQLDWAKGCWDIWNNIISKSSFSTSVVGDFSSFSSANIGL